MLLEQKDSLYTLQVKDFWSWFMSMTVMKLIPNKFQPRAHEVNYPLSKETEGGGKKQSKFIGCNFSFLPAFLDCCWFRSSIPKTSSAH